MEIENFDGSSSCQSCASDGSILKSRVAKWRQQFDDGIAKN